MPKVRPIAEVVEALRQGRSMAKFAEATGGLVDPQALARFADPHRDWGRPPAPDVLRNLAASLRLTLRTVWLSFGASLGLELDGEESELLSLMPAGTWKLSSAQVAHIRNEIIMAIDAAEQAAELDRLRAQLDARPTKPAASQRHG